MIPDLRHSNEDDEPFGVYGSTGPFGPGICPDRTPDLFQNLMMGLGGPQRRSTIRTDQRMSPNSNEQNTTISFSGGGGGLMMRGAVPPGGFFISTAGPGGNIDMLNTLFGGLPHSPPSEWGQGQWNEPPLPPNLIRQTLLSLFGATVGTMMVNLEIMLLRKKL